MQADDRKRIAQASVKAADSFELGQDPLDNLTGQDGLFANKSQDLDQDITLDIPVEGGKTAKLTVNAQRYIDQLNAREDALRMVKECMV